MYVATRRAPATEFSHNHLFAAIDMGSNSFKLLIFRAYPDGIFFPILHRKHAVVLCRDSDSGAITPLSHARALESLRAFNDILRSLNVAPSHTRCLATSTIREATNRDELLIGAKAILGLGLDIDVLSGEEEAALSYKGAIQFLPISDKLVLNVDIGGGSTEFTVGKQGKVLYCTSLTLGHVRLTQEFINDVGLSNMRTKIRTVIRKSPLVDNIRHYGFDVAVGSSGTVRALEKAAFVGFSSEISTSASERQWRLKKSELMQMIRELGYGGDEGKAKRDRFFEIRSEFIVSGAVLLGEIFEILGIEEMEVSRFALGEAAIADTVARVYDGDGLDLNHRWRSVVRLSTRLNSKKRVRDAAQCASIAKEIFEGVTKHGGFEIDSKHLEYIEAACLLHNVGLINGRKSYHKDSYHIIMNSEQLHGYDSDEIKFIALLARRHRKKFPKPDHNSLRELPDEICGRAKDRDELLDIHGMSEEPYAELARELSIFVKVFDCELIVQMPCQRSGS